MNFSSALIHSVFSVGSGILIGSFSAIAIYFLKEHGPRAPSIYIMYPLIALSIIHIAFAVIIGARNEFYYLKNGYYGDVDYHMNARSIYGGMISGGLFGAILLYNVLVG